MIKQAKFISPTLLFFFVLHSAVATAQEGGYIPSNERSSFNVVKKSVMDGNQLRATYHNSGYGGTVNRGENPDEFSYEFPRNTNRFYMLFNIIFLGTEVENQTDGGLLPIVDVAAIRTDRDGSSWTLNPIIGYQREDSPEMARSDRGPTSPLGNTWPDSWPDKFLDGGDGWAGSWNGFFGRDQFNADVEFYFKSGDDLYDRRSRTGAFTPDSTDPTRGGLALIMDSRILSWSITLLNATHFQIFEVLNDGTTNYDRVSFGLWIADQIGNDTTDDEPVFDNLRSIAYIVDGNPTNEPNLFFDREGEMGLQFLETPGNAIDGIDNDGDSFNYDPSATDFYEPQNTDLYANLLAANGGFHSANRLDSLLPDFQATDFNRTTISIGDKIVRIIENDARVIDTYTGSPFVSQGRTWNFTGNSFEVIEDFLAPSEAEFGVHIDGLDNDFDGLIDENQPNHLTKSTLLPNGTARETPVRYINYLNFAVGDTIQRGLIVSNGDIRARIQSDNSFAQLITDFNGRFKNQFTAAPMIDEARDDFFDNDQDWIALSDDVGIEGDGSSEGAGDGLPTSGAGTTFPGEPSIDATDVSETDLIGVTRVTIFEEGVLDVNDDATNWQLYMIPGEFQTDPVSPADIFVSSGIFPLRVGTSERFAVAITASQENSAVPLADRNKVNENLGEAFTAYDADYQFARAPNPPIVSAVARDGRVTLYWDDSAEESFDRFIEDITGNNGQGFDFHGYKVYRSLDPAFESVDQITDAFGSFLYYDDIATYDRNDGVQGLHPVSIRGTQFNQGRDSGLRYTFVDTEVTNGRTYFYAVTSFDYGLADEDIPPSESPIQISANPDGSFILGQNVVRVIPTETAAGFIDPENPTAALVSGSASGRVEVSILDPELVVADNLYRITFQDTLFDGGDNPDTLRTKNFSLLRIGDGTQDTLIEESTFFTGEELPERDGFQVRLFNESELMINESTTGWTNTDDRVIHTPSVFPYETPTASDFEIVIGDVVGFGESTEGFITDLGSEILIPATDTNFKLFNPQTGAEVPYIFLDLEQSGTAGELSAGVDVFGLISDALVVMEEVNGVPNTRTWQIEIVPVREGGQTLSVNPSAGDTLRIITTKPFTERDVFEFRINTENLARIDADTARSDLDEILVIPNPYIVSNTYEAFPPGASRQQNRVLRFTNLPIPSTLRIFNARGILLREIDIEQGDPRVEGGEFGGTFRWDMLTRDNLEIAYGIYIFQVDAPGVGSKTGKFAVIK
ncbi:MAG: hypothetical protein AAFW89_08885 [Bacteroidota bacterium]